VGSWSDGVDGGVVIWAVVGTAVVVVVVVV
jgi:hypothetical protein